MLRINDWLILALYGIASWVDSPTDTLHLRTDPACVHYRAPRRRSRLDRVSRGTSCTPCMAGRAWGRS